MNKTVGTGTGQQVGHLGEVVAMNARLVGALGELLDDTQHASHKDCEDGPCPVRDARSVLADALTLNGGSTP